MRGLPHGAVLQRGTPAQSLVGVVFSIKCPALLNCFSCRAVHKEACQKAAQKASAARETETALAAPLGIEAAPAPGTKNSPTAVCGFCQTTKEKLLLCSKCKAVRYCSTDHQRQHWLESCMNLYLLSFSLLFLVIVINK